MSWDYVYGTNLQHGLILARKMLAHQQGTKQIILVTDGEPTAHVIPYEGGVGYDVYFNYPPMPQTLEVTLAEVLRCTRAGITINTFLLDPDRGSRGSSSSWPGSTEGAPSPPHRTSSATTCWSTSWPTRPAPFSHDAGPAERAGGCDGAARRRPRRHRTVPDRPPWVSVVRRRVPMSAGVFDSPPGRRRNQNSCSQAGELPCVSSGDSE